MVFAKKRKSCWIRLKGLGSTRIFHPNIPEIIRIINHLLIMARKTCILTLENRENTKLWLFSVKIMVY